MSDPEKHLLTVSSMPIETRSIMYRRRRPVIIFFAFLATAIYLFQSRSQGTFSFFKSSAPACDKSAPRAHTKNGTYCGIYNGDFGQDFFLGLPYAKPPVAQLRFRAPKPLDLPFKGVKRATRYSDFCLGYGTDQIGHSASEDCLYLNVVRPAAHAGRDKLPVAIWIHGGGYMQGSASDSKYNLSFIVQEGVRVNKPFIGVSINYRLTVWGFLAGSDVFNSGQSNVGLRDQRLAMHWVHENIEAFGGDPAKVTIWGESAGASAVGFHLTAYGGRDDKLFRAAVMESGSPVLYSPMKDAKAYDDEYQSLVKKVGCGSVGDRLQCLRNVPSKTIHNIYMGIIRAIWIPVIDHDFIQKLPYDQLAAQKFVHVPIIAGANSDEGTSFTPQGLETPEQFRSLVEYRIKGNLVNKILGAYPDDMCFGVPADFACKRLGPPYGGQFRRAAAFIGDLAFIAPRRLTCTAWARAGLPAYCYRFNAHPADIPPELGARHFAEVAYVFANTSPERQGRGAEHARLAQLMARSWASFFVDSNPNSFRGSGTSAGGGFGALAGIPLRGADIGADTPQWPAYDAAASMQYVFDALPAGKGKDAPGPAGGTHVEADTIREEGIRIINSQRDAMGP